MRPRYYRQIFTGACRLQKCISGTTATPFFLGNLVKPKSTLCRTVEVIDQWMSRLVGGFKKLIAQLIVVPKILYLERATDSMKFRCPSLLILGLFE